MAEKRVNYSSGAPLEEKVGQMRTLVEQSGLKILEIMDSDTGEAVSETSERVYIVAKEQQKEL